MWSPLALSQRASFLSLAPPLVPPTAALSLCAHCVKSALGELASVSSLFCSPADRLEAANNRLGPCATASVPAPLLLRTALLEWFAGVGTMSHAFRHHGVRTHAQAEQDELKQRVLRHFFPLSVLVSDVFDSFLLPLAASVLIAAGIPCQPVAPGGSRLAHDDPRAFGMINAIPQLIAQLGDRYVSLDAEEHADLLSTGADILAQIDSSLLALAFPLVRSPALPGTFSPVFHSGKIQRRRLALRWELKRAVERIGPAPPLRPIVALPSRIANVALPPSAIRPEQYVHGRLRLLNHCVSLTSPTVCARVVLGGPHVPLFEGSRVHAPDTPRDFDNASMSKLNIKWFINGVIADARDATALRALTPGDAAVIIPGCTKADPFAIMFGDKPMYLEFVPTDPNNASLNLRDLELAFPVPLERRRSTPLFCSGDCGTPMSHEIADVLFHAACVLCFEPSVANALSLHSRRVWLACALLASDYQNPTI